MRLIHTIADLRAALAAHAGITLVPTMGNLHDGHLSLVAKARQRPGLVVASIFVNPLQFGPQDDFAKYPRTLEHDCGLLARGGCDIVFAPAAQEMYPDEQTCKVHPPAALAETLEGIARPGFFVGVCTVVLKLFNIVQPHAAVFGKKDFQQLLVIRNMVQQFALAVEIVAAETVRDADGLALSSRNGYLNERERAQAVQLSAVLRGIGGEVRAGHTDWQRLEQDAFSSLVQHGWRPDYVAIRRREDLSAPLDARSLVVLAAARLGGTRLIDNLEI